MKAIIGSIGLAVTITGLAQAATAQIIPDRTIPTNVTSLDSLNFTIDGGGRSGNNLFYSFSQFSVPTNGSAVFNNAADVQNIFSRVTGTTGSNIDGLIQANHTANLFLLNPNGLLFGPNARLDIGGSFIGTTASSIKFADNTEFSTNNPTPLLTMSAPFGLQMSQNPGDIQVKNLGHRVAVIGSGLLPLDRSKTPLGLQVFTGKTLALIGGEVELVGGIVQSPGGHIELGSARAGTVNLTPKLQGWAFDYTSINQFQDIRFSQRAVADASGDGGSIQIRGQNILFSDFSTALIQHTGSQRGGDLVLNAVDLIAFSQSQPDLFTTRVETQTLGTGSTGEIQITAQHLKLQNGANINTSVYASGGSAAIQVNVAESIELFGAFPGDLNTNVSRIVSAGFSGNSGDVLIATQQLSLRDGGNITSIAIGKNSNSGDVIINATNFIEMLGIKPNIVSSGLGSSTFSNGNGGNLTVNTPRLILRDGSTISSSTFASGTAGNVVVNASESLEVSGIGSDTFQSPSSIVASALSPNLVFQQFLGIPVVPTGNAGKVTINTPQFIISNGAEVGVNNIGTGNAGNLKITVDRLLLNSTGRITASTASGKEGNIILNVAELLSLRKNSQIETQAAGNSNGGNITINAPIILGLGNSDIIANAIQGKGGNIEITAQGIIGLKYRDLLTPGNDITASSEFGVNGTVRVNNIGVDPASGLLELPVEIIDPTQQVAQTCTNDQGSRFVVTGRGGVPAHPSQYLNPDRSWQDLRTIGTEGKGAIALSLNPPSPLIEATNWQRNANGVVEILASNSSASTPQMMATCVPH